MHVIAVHVSKKASSSSKAAHHDKKRQTIQKHRHLIIGDQEVKRKITI